MADLNRTHVLNGKWPCKWQFNSGLNSILALSVWLMRYEQYDVSGEGDLKGSQTGRRWMAPFQETGDEEEIKRVWWEYVLRWE